MMSLVLTTPPHPTPFVGREPQSSEACIEYSYMYHRYVHFTSFRTLPLANLLHQQLTRTLVLYFNCIAMCDDKTQNETVYRYKT